MNASITQGFGGRAKRSVLAHWLALLLLLFAQATLATHFHDAEELQTHDCAVCSQLHSVKHLAATDAEVNLPASAPTFTYLDQAHSVFAPVYGLPLARAPPVNVL